MKCISREFQPLLWKYIGGIAGNHRIEVDEIGGIEDHVHLLVRIPADLAVAKCINLLKSNSSKWVRERQEFGWQNGYGAFSVSESNLSKVANYIRNQAQHHKRQTFEEEYLTLLRKHGVKFDPEYVFD